MRAVTGEGAAKHGSNAGAKFSVRDVPSSEAGSMINGVAIRDDAVLAYFRPPGVGGESNAAFGLLEPELIGKETRDGRAHYRIAAKSIAGNPVTIWVEVDTSLVSRIIMQQGKTRALSLVETLYRNQRINPQLAGEDFAVAAPSGDAFPSAEKMGFGSVVDLVKQADVQVTDKSEPSEAVVAAPPPVASVERGASVKAGEQALSYEQMSGIVLIEGDGGTASGFMTKIRGVDFVVTNLHVLGGNKKLTLKTLSGTEIPVQGIFGAAGCDVAIIRVPAGQGELKLSEDVLKTSKIGDKVVVVGNRQGGGVATQISGNIVGIGPNRLEVDANFEPGNSGSPIVNLATGEVVAVASYSETRRVSVDDAPASARGAPSRAPAQVEKRWFGYRLDGISKWEAIDLAKWNAQEARIEAFRDMSEALVAVLRLQFSTARRHPRLNSLISNFEAKMRSVGGSGLAAATEVKDLFRVIRSISEDGVNDLKNGDYYDYYRTSLYWETSIPAQLDYRKEIVDVLKKYEANSSAYLSRMRGGN